MNSRLRPLDGVRVLSLENFIAGPLATALLADWGAEVVKVESGKGDSYRSFPPLSSKEDYVSSPSFVRINRSKESIVLDLLDPDDRATFLKLVRVADVVLQNIRPGALSDLGIDFEELKAHNPRIVLVSISGFGQRDVQPGPLLNLPAFDIVGQAMSGLAFAAGNEGDPPMQLGVPVIDTVTADWGATAALLGLRYRDVSDRAVHLDVSMYDVGMHLNEYRLGHYAYFGESVMRGGVSTSAPFDFFRASDGQFALAVSGDDIWGRFCRAIERHDLATDETLASGVQRSSNMHRLRQIIEEWSAVRTVTEVCRVLASFNVPASPVQTEADVINCPQAAARGAWVSVPDPAIGEMRVVANPVKADAFSAAEPEAAPQLGADGDKVRATWLGE